MKTPVKRGRGYGRPFVAGYDPRRHSLTTADRVRGGLSRARQQHNEIDRAIYGHARLREAWSKGELFPTD